MAKSKSVAPKILIALVVLAALAVGAELGSKAYVTSQLKERFAKAVPGEREPEIAIDSFPFLVNYFASGSVGDVRCEAHGVKIATLKLARVGIELRGVVVEGGPRGGGKVRVKSVDTSTITADLDRAEIARMTGAEVTLANDAIQLSRFGFAVTAQLKTDKGRVRLSAPPLPDVELPLPQNLFACKSTGVEIRPEAVRLRCEHDKPPVELLGLAPKT